jgi:carbonic anhydrase/acetyltransferase-like protein (isoleucine patch superfamily)
MSVRSFGGADPEMGARVYIDETAVVLGQVSIGEDSSVWPMAVVRGDINRIAIGSRTNVQDGSVLHVTHAGPFSLRGHPLSVGDEVTVGHGVVLHGCTIESRCLIGMGSLVMDGAVVKAEVILGAGSLVPPGRLLEGGYLWLGRPAKKVRALRSEEREYLRYAAAHYVRLKDRYLAAG